MAPEHGATTAAASTATAAASTATARPPSPTVPLPAVYLQVPPFRDSRITMLFRDYLSGNGQISVIAAVSPRASDAGGTLDTLRFAAIAQQVKIVDQPKPAPKAAPAPLPRVATQLSNSRKADGGTGTSAEVGAPVAAALCAVGEGSDEFSAGASALTAQVAALQQQLAAASADRVAMERSIREEVISA